jgi:molybdenum cofactor cytidylyltransferase
LLTPRHRSDGSDRGSSYRGDFNRKSRTTIGLDHAEQSPLRIVGILLAAGQGSRFGGGKLLAALPDGVAIGVQSARNLRAGVAEVLAVTRPEDQELRALFAAEGIRVEICPQARDGMGVSLAYAVRATREADAWIVALADMPMIRPATIRRLAAALSDGAGIVAPLYAGKRGHPVGFAREFGDALCALNADAGARELLRAHAEQVVFVDCADPGILTDIDTPADLERAGGRDD